MGYIQLMKNHFEVMETLIETLEEDSLPKILLKVDMKTLRTYLHGIEQEIIMMGEKND